MNVLSIDTAGPVIGVGLITGQHRLSCTERVQRGADAKILPWALDLVRQAGIRLSDLDGLSVAIGPGSFTGLRVGMAAAMGLSQSLNIPIWGSSSLVHRAEVNQYPLTLVVMDARKERVYAALVDGNSSILAGPADIPPEAAIEWCGDRRPVVTGEGGVVYRSLFEAAGFSVSTSASMPGVCRLADMGALAIANGAGVRAFELRPEYLRAPDAKKPKGL